MPRKRLPVTQPPMQLLPGEVLDVEAWCLRDKETRWAAGKVEQQWEVCRDHFLGTGELGHDWVATLRNWIRRAPSINPSIAATVPACRTLYKAESTENLVRLTPEMMRQARPK